MIVFPPARTAIPGVLLSIPFFCIAHPKTLPLACQVFLHLIDTRPGSHIRDTCGVASKDLYEVARGARAATLREKPSLSDHLSDNVQAR